MSRQPTPAQQATFDDLTHRDGVVHVRVAWEQKTMLLGVGMAPNARDVSATRMYRIEPDGSAKGV